MSNTKHTEQSAVQRLPALAELTNVAIAEAARAHSEPEWLIERRIAAWDFFAQAAPPEWRRTDLTQLKPEHIHPPCAIQGTTLQWDTTGSEQGVIFSTLKAALQTHPTLIRERMDTAVEPLTHKFSALRAALWQDGVFLYVPRNVELAVPLRVHYTFSTENQAIFPRSLVILEPNARVTFIEEYSSADAAEPVLAAPVTEIFAGESSAVRYISTQQWGSNVYHLGGQMAVLERDAACTWVSVTLGGQVQHLEAETRLKGDGSQVNWLGATFANDRQQLLTGPWLRHVGANAESFMSFKTVVTDKAYSVFDGMIKIEKESRGTSTRLEEHAIHLSPQSRSDSIPALKIDTNDVTKAGHASTSGQVDDEQLFYMQTRGIKPDDAKRLIVMGFFEPALSVIPVDELREALATAIEAKI